MSINPEGLVTLQSRTGAAETFDRLVRAVEQHGMMVFARIDQAKEAADAGLALRPTYVLLFGNPRAGTPLMQAAPSIAIDLPLKVLVWGEPGAAAQLAYADPIWLAKRHGLELERYAVVNAMAQAIAAVAAEAVS